MTSGTKKMIVVGWALFFSGCASVPLTPPPAGISTGKQFVAVPNNIFGPIDAKKARVFFITNVNPKIFGVVYRGNIRVTDSQTVIGELQSASYLCWEREPGEALIKFTLPGQEYDNGWFVTHFNTYRINTEGGQSYYLYFAGLAQRQILTAQDAMRLLSAYPPPLATATYEPAPVSNPPASQTKSFTAQKPV